MGFLLWLLLTLRLRGLYNSFQEGLEIPDWEALESYKLSLKSDFGRMSEDLSADSNVDSKVRTQISIRNKDYIDNWAMLCIILWQNMCLHFPMFLDFTQNGERGWKIINVTEEISKLPNIQTVAWCCWLILARFTVKIRSKPMWKVCSFIGQEVSGKLGQRRIRLTLKRSQVLYMRTVGKMAWRYLRNKKDITFLQA